MSQDFIRGECVAIENRGLTQETTSKWGYEVSAEERCHIANYRDSSGAIVGQKIRREGKSFSWIGNGKNPPLYGQWLWGRGKHIVIVEGEIDALSMSQALGNKWPVVSLPSGAQNAAKVIASHYEYLNQFDRVVLMLDQDDAGRKATEEACAVLPPGKAAIAYLEHKDANEVLLKQGAQALVTAFWNAAPWTPDGIVNGTELTVERLKKATAKGYELPYPRLQEMLYGIRKGELTLLTAGSGVGKSSWARELGYYLHQTHGCSIGNIFLEEGNDKTGQSYIAIHNNVPLGKLRANPEILTDEQWQDGASKVLHERMWFFSHFGSLESENLLSKIRYLATVCGVDFCILDHISIVVSGQAGSGDERRDIDMLMTNLRSLVEATGVGIIAIVHLNKPDGKAHEEGGRVTLSNLRGSGSLKQLSDNVLAMERDGQAEGIERMTSQIRVLKCRESGDTGEADKFIYNTTTGRLEVAQLAAL